MKTYRTFDFPPVIIHLESETEVQAMIAALAAVMGSQSRFTDPHRNFYTDLKERIEQAIRDPN
jgi:hypothetical protein